MSKGSRTPRRLIRDDGELLLLISVLEQALASGDIVSRSRSTVDRWLAQLRSMARPAAAQNVFNLDGGAHIRASESDTIAQIFEYWRVCMEKPHARLDAKRRMRIVQRLRDGYTPVQIMAAVDGCAGDDWSRGDNDRGVPFDDIELICRDSTRLERFIGLASCPARSRPKAGNMEAARVAWSRVIDHVRGGRYRGGAGVDDGGPIDAAVAELGGYRSIGLSSASDLRFIERRFIECFCSGRTGQIPADGTQP